MLFNRFHRNHNTKYSSSSSYNKCVVTRSSTTLLITRISFLLLLLLQNTYLVTNAQADFGGEEGEDDFGEYLYSDDNKKIVKLIKLLYKNERTPTKLFSAVVNYKDLIEIHIF